MRPQVDFKSQQFAESHPTEFNELKEMHAKIVDLEEENSRPRERCISLQQIQQSQDLCQFWTGFPNYGTVKALFDYLKQIGEAKPQLKVVSITKGSTQNRGELQRILLNIFCALQSSCMLQFYMKHAEA